jgi:hypothetical protein
MIRQKKVTERLYLRARDRAKFIKPKIFVEKIDVEAIDVDGKQKAIIK